ncbi:hypothetical protein BT96DRAFT_991276 [Gymnopus androsaceus JB14]|uniref:F-box domain-containing protein n=1 Tax=Gymnopus androsaceus JB14 TaxID=1447944 RepID=A0A6A4HV09_9AGAR|nr:hypothetical protein BT96DRAFT_991276 [Gymnopus androsaceus JB14]
MMVEPLPNELIECILENLYFDKQTLKNCALVGKAWVRASQRGIFEQISFDEFYLRDCLQTRSERLIAIFGVKPHLARDVRFLELLNFGYDKMIRPRYIVRYSLIKPFPSRPKQNAPFDRS